MLAAAIKHPGGPWRRIDIKPTVENIREFIGGHFEQVRNFNTEAIMYCNEDGIRLKLVPNFYTTDQDGNNFECIVGSVIMFGPAKNSNETDLTTELLDRTTSFLREV